MCPRHTNVMTFIHTDILNFFIFIKCLKKPIFIVLSINFTLPTCMQEILYHISKNQIASSSASSSAEWSENSICQYQGFFFFIVPSFSGLYESTGKLAQYRIFVEDNLYLFDMFCHHKYVCYISQHSHQQQNYGINTIL